MGFYVFNLGSEVFAAHFYVGWVLSQQVCRQCLTSNNLVLTGVCLQCANSGYQHCCVRAHARVTALDVKEALSTHVCTKARFSDEVVAAMNTDHVADD